MDLLAAWRKKLLNSFYPNKWLIDRWVILVDIMPPVGMGIALIVHFIVGFIIVFPYLWIQNNNQFGESPSWFWFGFFVLIVLQS